MSQSVKLGVECHEAGTTRLTFLPSSDFIRPRGIDDPLPTERDIAPTGELTLETTRILAGTRDVVSSSPFYLDPALFGTLDMTHAY